MLTPVRPARFRSDVERMRKRGKNVEHLAVAIGLLIDKKLLPASYRDHPLKGKYAGFRDCHIDPNWVLIYKVQGNDLILFRTGSHADVLE